MIHIKNALICDGTGKEPYPGELLLKGEKIEAVSPVPLGEVDAQVIDGAGMIAAPGFIDAHRHCDLAALYDEHFGEIELSQGITTAVMGNCGLAPAPCTPENREELYSFLEPCLGTAPGSSFFPRVSQFFSALESRKHPINLGVLGATGAITTAAKGFGNIPFDKESRKAAEGYVRDAMEAGALGLSCGIMYTPECWSTLEDFVFLAKLCREYGGYLTSHIRGEGASLSQSVEEVLEIGRRAQIPVNVSHFKVTGLKNHGRGIERAITLLERARASGQDATADAYPYTGGSTTILSLVPPTVLEEAKGSLSAYLSTKEGREIFAKEIKKEFSDWDNMVSSIGWERVVISSAANREYESLAGLDFSAAAGSLNIAEEELFCRLVSASGGKAGVIVMSMAQADVDRVLCLPWVSLISDALYGGGESPHPRLYGAFPKFLREYVREKKLLTLGEAVHKMTGLPAARLGLKDRGTLRPGNYGDLLLFDPAKFADRATWQEPKRLSEGLELVLVNGAPACERQGKVLKKMTIFEIKQKKEKSIMSKVEEKLKELGLSLPQPPAKGGLYSPAKRFGEKLVYISGCGPVLDGASIEGKLGAEVSEEQGYEYARNCMLNVLAVLKREIGDLDLVKSAVKVTCFVASTPDFYRQPQVANGGTQLLMDLFGEEAGAPTRSAIGQCVLPGNIPVETEALFELR